MKMKMIEAINVKNTLGNFINIQLPISFSYKIMKFISSVEKEEQFFNQKLKELIEEYSEKDNNGAPVMTSQQSFKIAKDKEKECEEKVKELENLDVEVFEFKISLEDIEKMELKVTPKELYSLSPIIEE